MAAIIKLGVLVVLLALGARGQEQQTVEDLLRDLHLRLNLMSLEFHEQMEQLVTEQQLLRQSVEKLSWVVERVDQSVKNVEVNQDVVLRNLTQVASQSDEIMINQQFCANHEALRDLYFETIPRCQGPPVTDAPPTQIPPVTTEQPTLYTSCRNAPPVSGVYSIQLETGYVVQVFCEQELRGGGWAVLQRRLDGSVDFNRTFGEYENGFGDHNGEHWLGLKTLHLLTNVPTALLIEMEDFSNVQQYILYQSFMVESESNGYRFQTYGYFEGTAGDSLSEMFFKPFVTYDAARGSDSSRACAQEMASGFWHFDCGIVRNRNNLNGVYGFNKGIQGVWWGTFGEAATQNRSPLKTVQMMVKF